MKKTRNLLLNLLFLLVLGAGLSEARQIEVSPNGEIQALTEAIARADSGDTIILQEGRYLEANVKIDKPLTIEGRGTAVIDGEGKGFVLIVHASNVTLRNIEVHHAGTSFIEDYAGILVEDVSNCLIENVKLVDNFFGIYLSKTSDSIIRNNTLIASGERETQSGNGIHLWYSKNVKIEGNRVTGHRDGIYFEFVEDISISGNTSENNLRYGLHFMFSDRCVYKENVFRDNGAGVAVMYTDEVEIVDNLFQRNWGSAAYGLLLKEISESRVEGNRFEENSIGIYMESSGRNTVRNNDFQQNGWAIKLMANSMDNVFEKNNFIENTFDVATNSRQNFNEFNNNYWSHYEGYDLDRDGIGDVPYRPVRLFSILVEKQPTALLLMRSMLIKVLDAAERFMPVLTPETLVDSSPKMRQIR
ncbi:nitrous oxide reductase family maturation protein NosD [Aliifodinibius sp. S!AR15-10]|uniref:nitrous oxide reductase family maturation protein NosD n=1 Tax=Aliifodinibius sp. S!AR15-10 TaxID=2950437 RepID=UPI002864CBF6|nr:nitrous oxide reductase family maturation protein NosD [Aliifodinibius sp. S!AR15-10]MDR8393180.1 nitrous oxide reductase family maturation protein NosD [Aliifodinibius sp. S!AR15-10]